MAPAGNGPFAASGHMVHAGGQAAHWDIQNKENSNYLDEVALFWMSQWAACFHRGIGSGEEKHFGRVIYASETIQNCKNPTGHIDNLNLNRSKRARSIEPKLPKFCGIELN